MKVSVLNQVLMLLRSVTLKKNSLMVIAIESVLEQPLSTQFSASDFVQQIWLNVATLFAYSLTNNAHRTWETRQ